MAGKAIHDWPSDDELVELVATLGVKGTADHLTVSRGAVSHQIRHRGLRGKINETPRQTRLRSAPQTAQALPGAIRVTEETVFVTMPATTNPELGDYDTMLRERGLDPTEWVVTQCKANEWDAMTSDKKTGDNRVIRMKQWTIILKPAPHRVLIMPAVHIPVVKRTRVGPPASEKPETIVVEGDHQIPYHDPKLHIASIEMLKDLAKKHRLSEQVYLGDTGDYSTISRHPDHPAASATPNECIQGSYNVLREKREAAPNIRVRKLKGNHDWRIEGEQLARSERMYGLSPATHWEDKEQEIPALHLNRLLHLPQLGVELVEDPRGWQHAEVELVDGQRGLVVRHGWLTGAKTAAASVQKRGRSIIVGHIHRREMAFVWDASMQCERVGCVAGTMSLCRDERFPHFTTLDNWLAGCVIVTRWPDGAFEIEHARWDGERLRWRDNEWRA